MTMILLALGFIAAAAIVVGAIRLQHALLRTAALLFALMVFFVFFAFSSIRYVGENEVGVVIRNFGSDLPQGSIIATRGEKGPQASILGPGWHFWLWPVIFDIETSPILEVDNDEVGLITTADGHPLPTGVAFAEEWDEERFRQMLDAEYFLTQGQGFKGPQASVLKPGKYRFNPKLYRIEKVAVTNIQKATVGVVKSNVGDLATQGDRTLVQQGQRGIWTTPLMPDKLYLNTKAYEVTVISTKERILRYTKGHAAGEETEIIVRTSDGFTFPVDVRIKYAIRPEDAPLVVSKVGDDQEGLRDVLNSAVRAIFRNNAESVKALDYVQQRSHQEQQSMTMLQEEMRKIGVTVSSVAIGDVGDEDSLGNLLKTQTDREIAVQEQETYREQQRAAEQKKELTRTEQEAEEERRLATASYEVQIAEQQKERRIIEANAEAEAIKIKAGAQADAYKLVAAQIGQGNAALVELLRIIGESGINITPRVMVVGNTGMGAGASTETTALIGTMLDSMLDKTPEAPTVRQVSNSDAGN
ncbi:MAG: hypothetical protein IT430_12735 [Phycisphaerales bacterium]|nr:hypothetical protein [Phycisphaerales bacterium]